MNKNHISTDALHGLDYLAHARVYSHKYIKREPDGKGGWVYTYPTMSNYNKPAYTTSYKQSDGTIVRQTHPSVKGTTVAYTRGSNYGNNPNYATSRNDAKRYREAYKAHKIYYEGLGDTGKTAMNEYPEQSNRNQSRLDSSNGQNIAQQAISSITTAAKNTYNAGKDFIKNLFSNAVTENYTITDTTTGQTIASGTRPSTMSAIAKDTYNAGINFIKKLFSTPIITTNKTITVTETRGEMRSPSRRR